jgi:hypothetical protein
MNVLDRKASTTPRQLEHYTAKRFKDSPVAERQAKKIIIQPSQDKDQEIARLRKELELLKMEKSKFVTEMKEVKEVRKSSNLGGAKAVKQEKVEVVERRRSADQQPKVKKAGREIVAVKEPERRPSVSQREYDSDSSSTVIIVDEGRRRRSSASTVSGRSSNDAIERRREPRYYSPRTSNDLGRQDLYVVEVTEAAPKTRKGLKGATRLKEVTIYQRRTRYTTVH